jgi:hypothetical protein
MTDTSKRTARKTSGPTPSEQALDPEAFLVNSQDHMDAFLKANETIMQSMAALNAEVMAFGNKRLSENFERSESLADCDGAEEAFRVHCAFFQTAAQQYLEQTTLGAYGIVSDHRSGERDRPVFFGIQSFGTIADRLDYWADAAIVRGEEENRDIGGFGIDLLGAYRFDLPLSPYLILGYAFGSGDADPDDGTDNTFRQTGLQGNEVEVGGLTPLRYYGEAFDPELSNMSIFTAGLGARPIEGVSLDLLYHHYQQDEAFDELRDSALDAEPNGENRRLGDEIDLVLGCQSRSKFRPVPGI